MYLYKKNERETNWVIFSSWKIHNNPNSKSDHSRVNKPRLKPIFFLQTRTVSAQFEYSPRLTRDFSSAEHQNIKITIFQVFLFLLQAF